MGGKLTWVEISRENLLHNFGEFKKILPPGVKFMAVVKANAYGHGLVAVARILKEKVDWFGVNNLEEALVLKKIGVEKPILILGYTPLAHLDEVVKNGFRQVVYNLETAKALRRSTRVHLKVETGTNRQGIRKEEILAFVKEITKYPQIEIEGIYTHLADVEEVDNHGYFHKQLTAFKEVIKTLEENGVVIPLKHTACTAAAILFPETYFNLVWVGIGLYGLWPSKEVKKDAQKKAINLDLRPVLNWKTKVVQLKRVKKAESVGYGCTFKALKDLIIAVLPVGYFDGYDRKLSNCGQVLIKGKIAPVVGRVCMNMAMVNISQIGGVKVEDEVVLLGKQGSEKITAEDLAERVGTINYEIVSRINPQIPRNII